MLGGGQSVGVAPDVARRVRLADRPHDVIAHRRLALDAVVFALQIVVEPADHVLVRRARSRSPDRRGRRLLLRLVQPAVQPGADEELLLAARVWAALVLPADEAGDRALAHEVVPVPIVKQGTFILSKWSEQSSSPPVVVVVRMAKPLFHEPAVVVGIAADVVHRLEALGPRGAADAIAFLKQAQAGIDHVLADEMRRLRDGEEVLGEAALRAAERADLAGHHGCLASHSHGVVAVLQLAPAEGAVADPGSFGEVGAAEVDEGDDVAGRGELGGGLASAGAAQVGVALLEDGRPGPLPGGK